MLLSDFDFSLPDELIAQEPAEPRDSARLCVIDRASGSIQHAAIRDLSSFLPGGTALVANNSRVRHARLQTADGREILLLEPAGECFRVIGRGKQPEPGTQLELKGGGEHLQITVEEVESGPAMTTYLIRAAGGNQRLEAFAASHGTVPLPPYITESSAPSGRYQTVYAGPLGSAAAPTAGLHFTPALIETLQQAGHSWHEVTLHVGLGTFLPLRQETIAENRLHQEVTGMEPHVATTLTETVRKGQPLLSVGTTSLRTLESHFDPDQTEFLSGSRETDLFLYPGKPVRTASLLLTNFHLPKSSLLLLVAAFLAMDADRRPTRSPEEAIALLRHIYETAIQERYRFFSFGDAMLIR